MNAEKVGKAKKTAAEKAAGAPASRTQEERRREMRRRLIGAALACLARDGYARTTVSGVVAEAGVSRGAHDHHFSSKEELMVTATESLVWNLFQRLGLVLLNTDARETKLKTYVNVLWRNIFAGEDGRVLLEILAAAQSEPKLAAHLSELLPRLSAIFVHSSRHYFRAKPGVPAPVEDLMHMIVTHLYGVRLEFAATMEKAEVERRVNQFADVFDCLVEPNPDAVGPPPKSELWNDF